MLLPLIQLGLVAFVSAGPIGGNLPLSRTRPLPPIRENGPSSLIRQNPANGSLSGDIAIEFNAETDIQGKF